ncbi:MAG: hypothetical protein WC989_06780 [Micavibrio sp.]
MKKTLLQTSTALETIFSHHAENKDTDIHSPPAQPSVQPDTHKTSRAYKMMCELMANFAYHRIAAPPSGPLLYHIIPGDHGMKLIFSTGKKDPRSDGWEEDQDAHPDLYDMVRSFMQDLRTVATDNAVRFDPDRLTVESADKLSMHKLLEAYHLLNDPDIKGDKNTRLIDDVFFDFKGDGKEMSHRETRSHLYQAARIARDIRKNRPAEAAGMFETILPKPYISMEHYEAALLLGHGADIAISLQHIYKTILHEDKIPQAQLLTAQLHGGFH